VGELFNKGKAYYCEAKRDTVIFRTRQLNANVLPQYTVCKTLPPCGCFPFSPLNKTKEIDTQNNAHLLLALLPILSNMNKSA
jgi:hypothetical protein